MRRRDLLVGSGFSVLLTWRFMRSVLPPGYHALLHPFPVCSVYLGALIDLAALSIVASIAWAAVERIDRRSMVWLFVLAGVVPFYVFDFSQVHWFGWSVSRWSMIELAAASAVIGIGLRAFRAEWFKGAVRIVRGSLILLGFSALWMVPELLYSAARSSTHEAPGFSLKPPISGSVASLASPRIVWLLLDELSYDQTYEHRWAGLKLPNFDRLLSESVTFTDVQPAGFHTEEVVPSLLLGRTVSQIEISADGELSVYFDDVRQWRRFDASQTIFADARRLGWTDGMAGWYIPYCRIMAGWVDSCTWANRGNLPDNLNPERGIFANAAAPLLDWLHGLTPALVSDRYSDFASLVAAHTRDYRSAMERAHALLRDSSIRFAYVHLNVPHPPGIYDRNAHVFSSRGSYLDNLALADEALGELLDTLDGTPAWSNTTLIVCGDHSWRVHLWAGQKGWTPEDEAASMGQRFDTRPVLSIHFAGQRVGSKVTSGFRALALHDVIEGLIRGQIRSVGELVRWTGGNGGRSVT